LISVVIGNRNPLHFKSIIPVVKPTASYLPHPNLCFALASCYVVSGPCFAVIGLPTPLPRKISYLHYVELYFGVVL